MIFPLSLVVIALLGACVGSFLNVVIYRVPLKTFFKGGNRSHCRACDYQIRWFDNIPILSWLMLTGKCRQCKAPISARYPLVELITAGAFVFLFWHDAGAYLQAEPGPNGLPPLPGWEVWGPMLFKAYLLAMLIASTFIDIDHRILPDVINYPTMLVGVIGACVAPGLVETFPLHAEGKPELFDYFLYSAVGGFAGYAITELIRRGAGMIFGKEAMGRGDVKFMAAIGTFVGWDGALTTFFLGSVFGAIYGGLHQWITKEAQIFFGPFLALGAVVTLFYKKEIIHFMFVTWPSWTSGSEYSPHIAVGIGLVSMVLLVFLVRRGRSRS